jgi:large subunit ribosomal protein L25
LIGQLGVSLMSAALELKAQERLSGGTGVARALRRQGMVPGIIYGDNKEPEMIAVDYKELDHECHTLAFFSRVITLNVGNKKQQVIAKDVQLDPVKDTPVHVDFQRVNKESKVHVSVPVVYINEDKAPGIKRGGTLNVIIHSLELVCLTQSIPEKLVVDLSGAEMGVSIHLESLKLPSGAKAAHADRDHVLVTIVAPSGMTEEDKEKEEKTTTAA